jgi:signal transduction histidine kinase
MAAASGIDLTPSVRARAVVIGDGERLRRVVRELLRNALRATSPAGHIRLDLEASDGRARLRVIDDGCGIAAADLPHIFEPFQRTRDRRQGARLGIGLAIAKYVADRHEGAMHAESAGEGRGAVFTLELPLADVA